MTTKTPSIIPQSQLPKRVFRVDRREPVSIFQNGFQVYGINSALRDHIIGKSCNTGGRSDGSSLNSSFIATTAEELKKQSYNTGHGAFIIAGIRPPNGTIVYVYAIRPTRNFYSGALSVEDYMNHHPNLEFNLSYILGAEEEVQEWVSHGSIPTEQIEYALMFRFYNGHWVQVGERQLNNRYQASDTNANPGPFTKIFSYDPDHSDDTEPQPGISSRQKRDINTTLTPYGYYIQGTKYNSCFGDAQSPIEKRSLQKNETSNFLSLLSDVIPVI